MSSPQPPAAPFAMSHRILVGALMAALVFIGIALLFVLPLDQAPPLWVPLAQLAAGAGIHLVLEAIGYRTPRSSPPSTRTPPPRRRSCATSRGCSCASPVRGRRDRLDRAGLRPAHGWWVVYGVGAVVSLVLMVVHVWPWSRPVGKAADALESSGRSRGCVRCSGSPAPAARSSASDPQTMSGAFTRASSASWSVGMSWLCRSASTLRR